jgi:hypothetical protein
VRTYADCLLRLGRVDEAERLLLDALEREERAGFPDASRRLRLTDSLGSFYLAINRADVAEKYMTAFRELVQSTGAPAVQETRMPEFPEE